MSPTALGHIAELSLYASALIVGGVLLTGFIGGLFTVLTSRRPPDV